MLAAGKGWVLAVLAMLGPKGLRVAARGSGPGLRPPLPSAARHGPPEASGREPSRPSTRKRRLPGAPGRTGAWIDYTTPESPRRSSSEPA